VAIKTLPDEFSRDSERVARFQREAEALAALNHPNIAHVYGLEESANTRCIVMELVEGETLQQRLTRGAVPVEEALQIAKQIAEALEAAHERGIIHRDLKPGNIMLTADGKVKVLDFGLAKALQEQQPSNLSNSPTMLSAASMPGLILGTAAYMSPEQARGQNADHRSDVFSFGCVLYEMLTGLQAFKGEDVSDLLASVMKIDPDFGALPSHVSPRLHELLRRCLTKSRKERWHAMGDLRVEIESIIASPQDIPAGSPTAADATPRRTSLVLLFAAALLGGVVTAVGLWYLRPSAAPPQVTRSLFTIGDGQSFTNAGRQLVAISPDRGQLAYTANTKLYLRLMSELEARPIPGIETTSGGVTNPVFSPDGRWIAYWAATDRTIKKIAVTGGAPVTLCPADNVFGMSWSKDWVFFGQGSKGILRVSENGGKPEQVVNVKSGESADGPQLLPGGDAIVYTLSTGGSVDWDKAEIVVQTLKSGERKTLIQGGSDARFVRTGHIIYAISGNLFAVPFDLRHLTVTGGPVPIVEGVRRARLGQTGTAHFSFSNTGSLIYVPGPVSASFSVTLALYDRKGAAEPIRLPPGPYANPRVSPDGKRIAYGADDGKEASIWVYDLSGTRAPIRLTYGGRNQYPMWSSDGRRVAFQSDREGDFGIFWQPADGTGTAERLTKPDQGTSHVPESWSPKSDQFFFDVVKESSHSLWLYSLQDKKATPFAGVHSTAPLNSVFSPDGRWAAYTMTETSGSEVYVQPVPATGVPYQISKTGTSAYPVWSADGRELFYSPAGGGGQFVAVSISTQPSFTFSSPVLLTRQFTIGGSLVRNYDITPDGRFIGIPLAGSLDPQSGTLTNPQIQVVLHWFEELKQRVPVH
jgi:serine/threonine-protein kinase